MPIDMAISIDESDVVLDVEVMFIESMSILR